MSIRALYLAVAAAVLAASAAGAVPAGAQEVDAVVHEGYELANVLVALHPVLEDRPHLAWRSGPYWEKVRERFGPMAHHPAVTAIPMTADDWVDGYYAFRNGGYRWRFEGDGLVRDREELFWRHDALAPRRRDVEDFARVTAFRAFFRENEAYYADLVARYRAVVDLEGMARWLEREFPATRIDRYVVVLSPLVNGAHNTRTVETGGETRAYMFVAGPDLDIEPLLPGYDRAVHERIVFTEIDHNFVNPETDRVRERVSRVVGPGLQRWNRDPGASYGSAFATFNEYMTWAVFVLYADETYSPGLASLVRSRVVRQMERSRGFPLFGAFDRLLAGLWAEREEGETVADLYPRLLERLERDGLDPPSPPSGS